MTAPGSALQARARLDAALADRPVLTDGQAMHLALDAACQGVRGANPLVGAVLVDPAGRLLQVGWHRGAGTHHAEADALARARAAGQDTAGASMFVTLEPCNHTGRTGPCSVAVADAGVTRLHYAYADTTEDAAGGAAYLRSRGVEVTGGLLASHSARLNERWFAAARERRPFVTAKIASSMDGYIAAEDGTSQWITGPEARANGHEIRQRADAILVGTATVMADNPQLTARTATGELAESQPLRVIMGNRPVPADTHLGQALAAGDALHCTTRNPHTVLDNLYERGVRHLLIEGGPTVISAYLAENLVDEIYWYRAPLLLGAGKPAINHLGISTLTDASCWQLDDLGTTPAIAILGADTAHHLTPAL